MLAFSAVSLKSLCRHAPACPPPQVVKYWPEKGKSGFLVWRYLLRRDDTEPEPWTREGKERMRQLGLTMQVAALGGWRSGRQGPSVHHDGSWEGGHLVYLQALGFLGQHRL